MPGSTLAAGTSLLAPATPVRVGGLQAQASAHLVKPLRWFAARSREFKDWAQRKGETP
jgi:hypothetical protein